MQLLDRRTFVDEVLLRQLVENLHHDGVNVFGSGHSIEFSIIRNCTVSVMPGPIRPNKREIGAYPECGAHRS